LENAEGLQARDRKRTRKFFDKTKLLNTGFVKIKSNLQNILQNAF
jgi:hypothetical protein